MITLSVTGVVVIFFRSLVNSIFSNFELIVFVITGLICSNKEVNSVV